MISEFNSLSEKVGRLAILAQTLRQENADLRLHLSSVNNDKEALARRMEEAHRRIAALLDAESAESEFAEERAV
jgi:cell division protein ZapB